MDCEKEYLYHNKDLPSKSFSFFKDKKGEFCDITFKVGERSISAHRIILSAAIPYFYKIFSDKEISESDDGVMTLSDVDPKAFECLIEFAYTCEVKITVENVKTLLSGACLLQVDEVRNACCCFLIERLQSENVLAIGEYASSLKCTELLEGTNCYIREHFEEVSLSADFLDISVSFLKELIGRDDLNAKSEENVFEVTMKWVKHSPEERQETLPDLLRNIRLPLVKPTYIRNRIVKEDLIRSSIECRDLLDEATYYHLLPEEMQGHCNFCTTPRRHVTSGPKRGANETPYIYIVLPKREHAVERFDSTKEKWETVANCDFSLNRGHTAAELDKKMYFFLPELTRVYDIERNAFSSCKKMTVPRIWAGSVSHTGKLYVCGGRTSWDSASNVVECFDPSTGEWFTLPCMNTCRRDLGVVASAEYIYVLGGESQNGAILNSVERYNLKTRVWSTVPPMLTERGGSGCATLNGKIYVCGGLSSKGVVVVLQTAEVFDPVANEWTFIPPMNNHRYFCKLVAFCGKLYILGGHIGENNLISGEIFEPEARKWRDGPPMNQNVTPVGAAVVSLPVI